MTIWPQNDAGWDFASRDHAPERDQQFPGQRYYQFCFSACTRSLGTFLKPKHQCALFLEPQKSPSELDQPSPNAGISGLCQSFLAAFLAAFVGGTGQSSVSAHGPSVAEVPGKHFSYQHVGCLDSDTHNACKKTYHGCDPASGAFSRCSRRVRSILSICCRTRSRRTMSRRISSNELLGIGVPSGVFSVSRRCGAFRSSGLKPRPPIV